MKVHAKIHTNSSQEAIRKVDEYNYEIWLKEKAENNKANIRLIKMLKKYFRREIKIKTGLTSRNKILELK